MTLKNILAIIYISSPIICILAELVLLFRTTAKKPIHPAYYVVDGVCGFFLVLYIVNQLRGVFPFNRWSRPLLDFSSGWYLESMILSLMIMLSGLVFSYRIAADSQRKLGSVEKTLYPCFCVIGIVVSFYFGYRFFHLRHHAVWNDLNSWFVPAIPLTILMISLRCLIRFFQNLTGELDSSEK